MEVSLVARQRFRETKRSARISKDRVGVRLLPLAEQEPSRHAGTLAWPRELDSRSEDESQQFLRGRRCSRPLQVQRERAAGSGARKVWHFLGADSEVLRSTSRERMLLISRAEERPFSENLCSCVTGEGHVIALDEE